MKLFLNRSKGSVTVLVTLILVPTIFLTGFMVDLARIKLYSNQAVMTADNYGEAVLTYYDNVLKELYGLFAVTQNEEALDALESLEDYMKSSFTPNSNTISWGHVATGNTIYSGFMPYSAADVTMSYQAASGANLGNTDVLSTQIGDFMRFRIAQAVTDDGGALIEALERVQNTEQDARAIDKKTDLDEKAEDALTAAQLYYEKLREISQYPDYVKGINEAYASAQNDFQQAVGSASYQIYSDYVKNEDAIEAALTHRDNLEEGESLSEEESRYIEMYNKYMADPHARTSYFAGIFDDACKRYLESIDKKPVNFENFEQKARELQQQAKSVKHNFDELQAIRTELETILNDPGVSEDIKKGIEEELKLIDDLFEDNGSYSASNYIRLADHIYNNVPVNNTYESEANKIDLRMEEIQNAYLYCRDTIPDWWDPLNESDYNNYRSVASYKKLEESLEQCFGNADSEGAKQAKAKKSEAKAEQSKYQKMLSSDESSEARNIPSSFGFGRDGGVGDFAIKRLIKSAAQMFSYNSFSEAGNALLLKLYTVEYDFGMFSNRLTNNKENSEDEEKAVSLTGYEMSKEINYLYQAELEYIFGGYNGSKDNLNSARNKILAFRGVINYAATYSVDEVDKPIKELAKLAAAVNPALGIAVSAALRTAVCLCETYWDWEELMKGNSVVVFKNELADLTAYDKFKGLIGADASSSGESKSFKMDYEQYLLVMIVFLTTSDEVLERTSNLITLNVNTVTQSIGSSGTLSKLDFTMDKAVTAIDATCSVHLDFAVMPDGFAQMVVSDEIFSELQEFEKNTYKFTVTRGY